VGVAVASPAVADKSNILIKPRESMPLDEKTKELVALGAALAGNCLPCLTYHYKKCRELGIDIDDLDEALDMAKAVKEVPIKKIYQLATLLLEGREESDD
jgi:AhpD family alkylhydroperoxidase